MRENIKQFVSIVQESLPIDEPIYEFGSLQVPDQIGFADLRLVFPKKEYIGCDIREGPGVDRILDLHRIDLLPNSVGTVLCLDTLEHVEYPHTALQEVHRILKPNGIAVISSVMDFPIHDYPADYWRFTPEGFRSLLKPFRSSFIGYAGNETFPHTVVGIGFKGDRPSTQEFEMKFDQWKEKQSIEVKIKRSWRQIVRLFIPPIFIHIKNRLQG